MTGAITSLQNPQVKLWRGLNKSRAARTEAGLFLAEGEHMASEAVKEQKARALLIDENAREKYCALAEDAKGASVYYLAVHVMAALCDAKTPQGIIAVCDYPQEAAVLPENAPLLVALDGVQDPGNVGTVIRTMDAAGYSCLLMDEKTADPYSPKALRASMGGVFRVPARRYSDLANQLRSLARHGYDIVAGDLHGEPFYQRRKVKEKFCVVIGNEGQGVSPAVFAESTLRLKLPMLGGAESLNAAVAGAIMMYDFIRERTEKT
ncbi:MAG: RNA methyltransferase [Clostridia bacterium]|nr:RNA methyltransferase [Clostridia bacterium]